MKLIGSTSTGDLVVEFTPNEWREVQTSIQGEQPAPQPVLNVPHISQRKEGALAYRNDCGMACVAMAIHALTDKRPSVDFLMNAHIEKEKRGKYLGFSDLIRTLKAFGLKPHFSRPFHAEHIKMAVEIGSPCIVLVKYPALPKKLQAIQYNGSHFIVISAYENDAFMFNDPLADEPKWITATDLHTAMSGFRPGENLPYQGMIVRK